jgi:hypothetical protein
MIQESDDPSRSTAQPKEAILGALEAAGGKEDSVGYSRRLVIENSSASTLGESARERRVPGRPGMRQRLYRCRWNGRIAKSLARK